MIDSTKRSQSWFDRIRSVPFVCVSHAKVSPDTLSLLGSCLTIMVAFAGLFFTGMACTAAGHSFFRGLLAIAIVPGTVVVAWAVTGLDYIARVFYHRIRDRLSNNRNA